MIVFEQKKFAFGQIGCIREKVVLIMQNGCIREKRLYSGEVVVFGKTVVFSQ